MLLKGVKFKKISGSYNFQADEVISDILKQKLLKEGGSLQLYHDRWSTFGPFRKRIYSKPGGDKIGRKS
jgi:hypothetical protein